MRRLAGGEDLALNEIMSRWQERVASFVWNMTRDEALMRDLTQETFVRLYQHRHRYQPKAPFGGYVFRIARNLIYNHQRWKQRHPQDSLDEMSERGFDPADDDGAPDDDLAKKETAREVRRAIAQLPLDLRAPLVLSVYEELSHREIGAILECSEKAVETRIYRARQWLKESLTSLSRRAVLPSGAGS
jgi:RNA polymerase sigma-70 factor (ECF subfamily)